MIVFFLAVIAAGLAWWQREPLRAWLNGQGIDQQHVFGWWHATQTWGAHELEPILKALHIRIAPELAFNLLAIFLALLLLRNLYSSLVRARNRRAYERAQANRAS